MANTAGETPSRRNARNTRVALINHTRARRGVGNSPPSIPTATVVRPAGASALSGGGGERAGVGHVGGRGPVGRGRGQGPGRTALALVCALGKGVVCLYRVLWLLPGVKATADRGCWNHPKMGAQCGGRGRETGSWSFLEKEPGLGRGASS